MTGPDAELLESSVMERPGLRIDGRAGLPSARAIAELAREIYERDGGAGPETGPLYLRPSEAEETAARGTDEAGRRR